MGVRVLWRRDSWWVYRVRDVDPACWEVCGPPDPDAEAADAEFATWREAFDYADAQARRP